MISRALAWIIASLALAASAHGLENHLHDVAELSLDSLGALPRDPSNRWADDDAAAKLGERLFFDTRLSSNGKVSCATCHDPKRQFQDGRALAKGVGTTDRRTMPIAGTAYSPFLFWDGRKDSLWAQALGPLESPVEHGGTRAQYAQVVATHYKRDYERTFGPMPELRQVDAVTQIFVNIGKAIAAFERHIQYVPTRFDRFVSEWKRSGAMPKDILDAKERAGLALFVGKANCTQCHNGPLFTNNEFHNTGVPAGVVTPARVVTPAKAGAQLDLGRFAAVAAVQSDEFNCRSRWSDAKPAECAELEFLAPAGPSQVRAYKVPSLRGAAKRAPYMHAGQFATMRQVLNHYNTAPRAPAGHTELKPLNLSKAELQQLEAFLRTLN
jgi:cytochrome c peroxidase